ncbi:MAG: DNA gyrase inhibitor YacG [Bdellovibrionales bacterium]
MEREIDCPQCKAKTRYSLKNSFRPFCSERCQLIDLGEWAEGNYSLVSDEPLKEEDILAILDPEYSEGI